MPYSYLEDIATSDVAFEASGKTIGELFIAAADATMNVMVEDLSTIKRGQELSFEVVNSELDMLLFNFLNELVFFKDARKLLLRVDSVSIEKKGADFNLFAAAYGEVLDPKRHPPGADVKAVTLHRFNVEETEEGWRATVVLDI